MAKTNIPIPDQPPPHDLIAEMSLLGAMILEPAITAAIADIVPGPEAFFIDGHAVIYRAIIKGYERDGVLNLAVLASELDRNEALEDLGGTRYLEKLCGDTPGPAAAPVFARRIAEKHQRRRLVRIGVELAERAQGTTYGGESALTAPVDVSEIATMAMDRISKATTHRGDVTRVSMAQACQSVFSTIAAGKPACWTTLFPSIDREFPFPKGQVIVVMGSPSSGKTTLVLQILSQIAEFHKVGVDVYSNEQRGERIAATLLSQQAGVPVHDALNRGQLPTADEWRRVTAARAVVEGMPLTVIEESMHAGQIFSACKVARERGVELVMVDYIQDLAPMPQYPTGVERYTESMRVLKNISRELGLTTVIVSQIDKQRGKSNEAPQMGDGLYSGAIEQAADVVMAVWRPGRNDPPPRDRSMQAMDEWKEKTGETRVLYRKNKYGPLGEVTLRFNGRAMSFQDDGE